MRSSAERVKPPRRKQLEILNGSAERGTRSSAERITNGINTYVRPKLNNFGLLLPPNFDCRILFDLVKSKAKVFNSNISLSFQHPVYGYVMNILDEADVHQLRNVISETKEIVHLYLEVFQGLVEQTEAAEKVVPYNVENIVSDIVEDCPEEETVALNTVEEKNLYEFGKLTDKTFSEGEESNEGWSEDEFTHGKKASDIFYGMPPIPDCPDPILEPGPFHSLGPNDDMFVRQTYDNKQQLIFALSLKATREYIPFHQIPNASLLYQIKTSPFQILLVSLLRATSSDAQVTDHHVGYASQKIFQTAKLRIIVVVIVLAAENTY
ncbi:unnamed protein product [Lactuca saligna]|uniref:Uncharacterized protein n=1 Tax=Lactuca saligna TaxID=75948 RepID=A0AA35V7X5_LACSI|nr:unnamed protein product [Lactuca saligna]